MRRPLLCLLLALLHLAPSVAMAQMVTQQRLVQAEGFDLAERDVPSQLWPGWAGQTVFMTWQEAGARGALRTGQYLVAVDPRLEPLWVTPVTDHPQAPLRQAQLWMLGDGFAITGLAEDAEARQDQLMLQTFDKRGRKLGPLRPMSNYQRADKGYTNALLRTPNGHCMLWAGLPGRKNDPVLMTAWNRDGRREWGRAIEVPGLDVYQLDGLALDVNYRPYALLTVPGYRDSAHQTTLPPRLLRYHPAQRSHQVIDLGTPNQARFLQLAHTPEGNPYVLGLHQTPAYRDTAAGFHEGKLLNRAATFTHLAMYHLKPGDTLALDTVYTYPLPDSLRGRYRRQADGFNLDTAWALVQGHQLFWFLESGYSNGRERMLTEVLILAVDRHQHRLQWAATLPLNQRQALPATHLGYGPVVADGNALYIPHEHGSGLDAEIRLMRVDRGNGATTTTALMADATDEHRIRWPRGTHHPDGRITLLGTGPKDENRFRLYNINPTAQR